MNALIPVTATGVPRLALSYDQTAATFDPSSSELVLSSTALSNGFDILVTVIDASGDSTNVYRLSAVSLGVAPRCVGTLGNVIFDRATGDHFVNASAAFTGDGITYELANALEGVSINAATGLVTLSTRAPFTGTVTVRARNAAGSVTQGFSATVRDNLSAPVAAGTFAAVQLTVGDPARTVNAALAFTGMVSDYSLVGAPANVSIDAATGVITISTASALTLTSISVKASNPAGSATQTLQVTIQAPVAAPVAAGTLAAVQLTVGDPARTVNAAQAFTGMVSDYSLVGAPANVSIDAATGVITISTASALALTSISVKASNLTGSATQTLQVTIEAPVAAPVAVGAISTIYADLGAADRLVNTALYFTGLVSQFSLRDAPANVTISPTTGIVTVSPTAVMPQTPITVVASNAGGSATQTFPLVITYFAATTFNSEESLAAVSFITPTAPSWTFNPEGYGRLVLATKSRAHGNWTGARGDGIYRTLVRWSGASLSASVDRRFTFGARVRLEGLAWYGVRVETFATSAGDRRLHIREYSGDANSFVSLATVSVGWDYDTWYWLDVEVAGSSIRARLYPELSGAPDWQAVATTTQLAPGAFGPGGFPALQQSPIIDVRRIEYRAPRP